MSDIAEMVIAVADLAEAEARSFRQAAIRAAAAVMLIIAAAVLFIAGLSFIVWAGFDALSHVMTPPVSAVLVGLILLGFAGGTLCIATKMSR